MFLSLRIALASLAAHKLRTALAVLGVLLGALALTGVQHVSQAMVRKAELEIERLGPNLFMASAGQVRFFRSGDGSVRNLARTFTLGDAQALVQGIPGALAGAPFAGTALGVRAGNRKVTAQVVGTTTDYTRVRSFSPAMGRFFSEQEVFDAARVCVLGENVAKNLFDSPAAALGQNIFLFRASCRVIGVMEPKGADIVGSNQDDQLFTPISTYTRRFANQNWISGVYIQLAPSVPGDLAKDAATAILRERHKLPPGRGDDFSVITAKDTIELQQQALDLVQTLGAISSGICFAVGGLGILSIMILLVRARRLEIGVRRATGARRRHIVSQFLLEAGLLSGAGGVLGVAGAMLVVLAAHKFGGFPLVFDPLLSLGVMVGAALLGLAAGAYPAWQASRLEILDVLRES